MEKGKLKKFRVCAGLMKKFVVCVCVVKCSKEIDFNHRSRHEKNCNLC